MSPDILLFAIVAVFLAFRLRNVLGKRTGNERRRDERDDHGSSDNVITLPRVDRSAQNDGGIDDISDFSVKQGLTDIRSVDQHFDLDHFLEGSKAAFEMIVDGFAAGDKQGLQPLLASDVYDRFAAEIDKRDEEGHATIWRIVTVHSASVASAVLEGNTAKVTVKFDSEQIAEDKGTSPSPVDSQGGDIERVVDLWTFARNVRDDDPNWSLVQTAAPDE